jgi:hypothetical protein
MNSIIFTGQGGALGLTGPLPNEDFMAAELNPDLISGSLTAATDGMRWARMA